MTDKKPKIIPPAPIYWDSYGVEVVNCPHCDTFHANVKDEQLIHCSFCKKHFIAVME